MSDLFNKELEYALESMAKGGAFLTVSDGERTNTMTIGWGYVGFQWQRPVFIALVRKSRFTHELLESATEFTVSIPVLGTMKHALGICGAKSGRDCNKFQEGDLTLAPGKAVGVPVIAGCAKYLECRIVYRQDMGADQMDPSLNATHYEKMDNDYHTLYFGELLESY